MLCRLCKQVLAQAIACPSPAGLFNGQQVKHHNSHIQIGNQCQDATHIEVSVLA